MNMLWKAWKRFAGSHMQDYWDKMERMIRYNIRHDLLIHEAITSKEPGITQNKLCNEEVVVSLTTYGRRLLGVSSTIESIMQGSVKPNRICLWIDESLKNITFPQTLLNQVKRGLEIGFCKDIGPHTKLVPTLAKYPEASIITIDDDAIYDYDLVETLVSSHIAHPKCIVTKRVGRLVLEPTESQGYKAQWGGVNNRYEPSLLHKQSGVGGYSIRLTLFTPK